MNIKYYNRK